MITAISHLSPASQFRTPLVQPIGAYGGASESHTPLLSPVPATRAAGAWPTHVLICVGNAGVRELIGLLLADAGYAVTGMDVAPWLIGDALPGPPPEVLILDAWPLRHADAAIQAHARLATQAAALVLLVDSPQPAQLADQFGAVATLPLSFTLHDLVTAMQQSSQVPAREPWGQP